MTISENLVDCAQFLVAIFGDQSVAIANPVLRTADYTCIHLIVPSLVMKSLAVVKYCQDL